jgi:hypothetical protein
LPRVDGLLALLSLPSVSAKDELMVGRRIHRRIPRRLRRGRAGAVNRDFGAAAAVRSLFIGCRRDAAARGSLDDWSIREFAPEKHDQHSLSL